MNELLVKLREAHKTNAQLGLFLLSLIMYGAACLFDTNNPVYVILLAVASTIIATLIASYIDRRYCGGDIEKILLEHFAALKSYQTYKLTGIAEKNFPIDQEPFRNDFITSEKVIIVMNDAKNFLSDYLLLLEERFKSASNKTTAGETIFILLDYEEEWLMSALRRRNGHDKEKATYYKDKIETVINRLRRLNEEAKNNNHRLKLFLYKNFNTLTVILTNSYVMESIYRLAPYKSFVPHFIFEKGGKEYYYANQDISEKLFSLNEDGTYKYIRDIPL